MSPVFVYECIDCGTVFEELEIKQYYGNDHKTFSCPKCSSKQIRKKPAAPASFVIKGVR